MATAYESDGRETPFMSHPPAGKAIDSLSVDSSLNVAVTCMPAGQSVSYRKRALSIVCKMILYTELCELDNDQCTKVAAVKLIMLLELSGLHHSLVCILLLVILV